MSFSSDNQHFLSKSEFFRGTKCSKAWKLFWTNPKLKKSQLENYKFFQAPAQEVLLQARKLFPRGLEIKGNTSQKIYKTLQAIKTKAPIIYNAHFARNGVIVSVDILKNTQNDWQFFLVKSASKTKRKYVREAALIWNVLKSNGVSLCSVDLLHINTGYILKNILDLNNLFIKINLTDSILNIQSIIDTKFDELENTVSKKMPEVGIGMQCLQPLECEFKAFCWPAVPEISIFNLTRLATEKKVELYLSGIIETKNIPKSYPLNKYQKIQKLSEETNTRIINKHAIKKFLNKLTFPLYFLDFEVFQTPCPIYEGDGPFEFLPVQFSLHFLKRKEDKLQHKEFIAERNCDPRLGFAKALIKSIPSNACILVYNAALEKKILKKLPLRFPQMGRHLKKINSQLVDLIEPFNKKYVYDPQMKGKTSIKSILPVLIPEMEKSYKNLNIKNGTMYMDAFGKFLGDFNKTEEDKIRESLLEYCKLDTLAMVKIWQYLDNLFPILLQK